MTKFERLLSIVAIVMAIMTIMVVVFSCQAKAKDNIPTNTEDYIDLTPIARDDEITIYRDRNTNVLYYRNSRSYGNGWSSSMTVIFNADGTPKLYEGD